MQIIGLLARSCVAQNSRSLLGVLVIAIGAYFLSSGLGLMAQ
jgi:hypothetical protein